MCDSEDILCGRCNENSPVVKTRKELFCKDCFSKFILLKQRRTLISDKEKFLESVMKVTFKTPNDDKILLALSLGKSSLLVLKNLVEYLNNQYSQQQLTGFVLETLTVVENDEEYRNFKRILKLLQHIPEFEILNKNSVKFRVVNINKLFKSETMELLKLGTTNHKLIIEDVKDTGNFALDEMLLDSFGSHFKTLSSKEDFKTIAINNTIEAVFKKYNYKALLYGSSMTKLATEIVTNTVTGRGGIVAKNLDAKFYPLTDVFYSEVEAYYFLMINNNDILLKCEDKSSSNSVLMAHNFTTQTKKSRQLKTISDITMDYFNTIEGDYANVISTVVKTGLKLRDPNTIIPGGAAFNECRICHSKISAAQNPADWINKITVMTPADITSASEKNNHDNWEKETMLNNGKKSHKVNEIENGLCYGCIVTLNTSNSKSIQWNGENSNDELLEQVLEDYVL